MGAILRVTLPLWQDKIPLRATRGACTLRTAEGRYVGAGYSNVPVGGRCTTRPLPSWTKAKVLKGTISIVSQGSGFTRTYTVRVN